MPLDSVQLPLNGLDDRDSFMLEAGYSPNLRNMRSDRQRMHKAEGYEVLSPIPATVAGTPRNLISTTFTGLATDSQKLVMLTHQRAYVFRGSVGLSGDVMVAEDTLTGATSTQRFGWAAGLGRLAFSTKGMTIGADQMVRSYSGTLFSNLIAASSSSEYHSANIVLAFNDRIITADLQEGNISRSTKIRWPAATDVTDWRPTTPGAGSLLAEETSNDGLTGGFVHIERCFLLKRRELIELIATGTLRPVFRQRTLVAIGCIARRSVATSEYFAFWVGPDDVYQWDGQTLTPIGDRYFETIKAALSLTNLDDAQGAIVAADSEYRLLVGDSLFIYDYKSERWFRDAPAANLSAVGVVDAGQALTEDVNSSQRAWLATSDLRTHVSDASLYSFAGAAYESYFETKDFMAQAAVQVRTGIIYQPSLERQNSLWRVLAHTTASAVIECGYSTDRGVTWTTESRTATADGILIWFVETAYTQIRFRFRTNTTSAFQLEGVVGYEWTDAGMQIAV